MMREYRLFYIKMPSGQMHSEVVSTYCMCTEVVSTYCMCTEVVSTYCMCTVVVSTYCMCTVVVPVSIYICMYMYTA